MERKQTGDRPKPSEVIAHAITEEAQTDRPQNEVPIPEEDSRPRGSKHLTFRDWLFRGPRTDDLEILARVRSPMREANP
jgi:hypothetical protein